METAAAQPLPQPQLQPQSQIQSQPQPQADAQTRAAAQHAKAKQAQAEYRRLQYHFAKLERHGRIKGPPWQCPGSVVPPQRAPSALGNDTPTCGDKGPWAALTASKPAALNVADPTSFGPPQGTRAAGSVDCGRGATEHAAGAAADLGEHRTP